MTLKSFDKQDYENIPANIAVFKVDKTGWRPLAVNTRLSRLLGLSAENLANILSERPEALFREEELNKVRLMLYKGGITGGMYSEMIQVLTADGSWRWIDLRLNAVPREDGTFIFNFIFMDIDNQKRSELRLEHTYEQLIGVVDNAPGGIVVYDARNNKDLVATMVSSSMLRMLKGTRAQAAALCESDAFALVHPDDHEKAVRAIEDAIRLLTPFHMVMRLRTIPGAYIWTEVNANVEIFEDHRQIYATFSNVSEDREERQVLKQVLDSFTRQQYDFICYIDKMTGKGMVLNTNGEPETVFPDNLNDYKAMRDYYTDCWVEPKERDRVKKETELDNLTRKMENTDVIESFMTIIDASGRLRYKKLWFCWVDKEKGTLAMVCGDCTEIHRQEEVRRKMLADALKAAEQASVAKSEFLSRMSHDIRTPLNAIIGFTDISIADPETGERTKERLSKIETSSRYLLSLVNDVLDMSRIESGKLVLKEDIFSFSRFNADIISMIASQCESKGITFRHSVDLSVRSAYIGDYMKLQQVVINILGNAVKYTRSGGTVTLSAREKAAQSGYAILEFKVKDTGIGISEEYMPRIFDAFSQENNKYGARQMGSGLGLAICRSIVVMMKGSIDVVSELNKGSLFTITVQLGVPADNAVMDTEADELKARADANTYYDFTGKHALLVEDHPLNQEIAEYLLTRAGMSVEIADNGLIACEKFTAAAPGKYDVILMDIRMPVMDGLTATKKIRGSGREDAAKIPIIAMSANAFEEDISRSLAAGLNAHLVKPIDAGLLYETLHMYIR